MKPRRVIVHTGDSHASDYPALLVDTRYRERVNPGFTDGRMSGIEEALVVRLDPDPDTAYAYDWVPLGRLEDAEDDIRPTDGPTDFGSQVVDRGGHFG